MIEERTTTCEEHQHPEFAIQFEQDYVLEEDVNWLLSSLQELVASGQRFKAGDFFQIGWLPTQIEQRDDKLLTLSEPDMKTMPVVYTPSVTNALLHLRWHKEVASSFQLADQLTLPNARHSAIICNQLGKQPGFAMARNSVKENDCGWVICCSDENHDHSNANNLQRVSLYDLCVNHLSKALPFLALPPDSQILIEDQAICLSIQGNPVPLQKDSFLQSLGYLDSV